MCCHTNTPISHPWLAPPETYGRERKDPRNTKSVILAQQNAIRSARMIVGKSPVVSVLAALKATSRRACGQWW